MFANQVVSLAGPGAEGRPAEIDLARVTVAGDVERLLEAVRNVERAHEVAAGAAMDDRELDAFEARDAVDDLVHGSVTTDRDKQASASRGGLLGEVDEVARALGKKCVAGHAPFGCRPRDLRPALAGGAVVGRRVDQEDGLANESPTSRWRARRASSCRRRPGGPRPRSG